MQYLQRHIEDAERQLQAEEAQYQQSLLAANAAQNAVQQTQGQLATATAAFATIQQSVTQKERAAAAASTLAATQHEMIQEAQQRLGRLHLRLNKALTELQETQVSVQMAAEASQLAQSIAAASAQFTFVNSVDNQSDGHESINYSH